MKKIIVILMLTGSFYAQDDIILKSAGTDASKGIVFQNSDADTLMDINGDGLISISGSLTVKLPDIEISPSPSISMRISALLF